MRLPPNHLGADDRTLLVTALLAPKLSTAPLTDGRDNGASEFVLALATNPRETSSKYVLRRMQRHRTAYLDRDTLAPLLSLEGVEFLACASD